MNRTILTITLLSSLATPFVVQAMTPAREAAATAAAQPAPVQTVGTEPAKTTEPSCIRKVKVVYAGYGEGAGRGCVLQSAAR